MGFYTHKKISGSTTCIIDKTGVHCFLVEGTDKAMLIDTANGVKGLKEYVEQLTALPVEVLLTHGHCDHAGGATVFDTVYLNRADWELVSQHASMESKMGYVKFCGGAEGAALTEENFVEERQTPYLDVQDGQPFDLGGITLEAVAVPGHTKGMTCVLNRQERSILFGDACNPAVFLWADEATDVASYKESLKRLQTYEDRYDTVYLSHASITIDKDILENVIDVCDDILNGTSDDQPYTFMDYEGIMLAKSVDETMARLDGKQGNIVYRRK
jgi:glyoxylase-like metal-dependent hydrolase (beta-lactamase superfamily II)